MGTVPSMLKLVTILSLVTSGLQADCPTNGEGETKDNPLVINSTRVEPVSPSTSPSLSCARSLRLAKRRRG